MGESVTAARLPSALEGSLLVTIVGLIAARLAGHRAGVLSALVVGSTLGVGAFSRAAHPELGVVTSVVTTQLPSRPRIPV
jgi:4-amino-4-deoxy-L-arabinose transferase-like glycosyltransferase